MEWAAGWSTQMARYIVVDNETGRIVGDTGVFEPTNTAYEDPFSACRDIDDELGIRNRVYYEQMMPFSPGEPGYIVYCATDEIGRERVPLITDFADPEQLQTVRANVIAQSGSGFSKRTNDRDQCKTDASEHHAH